MRALHDGTPWPLVIVLAVCAVLIVAGDLGARTVERRAAGVAAV